MLLVTLSCVLTVGGAKGSSCYGPGATGLDGLGGVEPGVIDGQENAAGGRREDGDAGGLTGTVVDASGALLGEARVEVRGADGRVQRTVETDSRGAFDVRGLGAGTYRVRVSRAGFEGREVWVVMRGSEAAGSLRIALTVGAVRTTVDVQGRESDLTGIADSATQGTVGAAEIRERPMLRSGEVLETVPGVIITQHAGGGKANQYFLRGFNLDHGTDFAVFLDGMPLNLPSHAHGEGYADMNAVIPEFVGRVNYEKGPYYAEVGNYSSAGSAQLELMKTLPEDFMQVEGGMFGYGRAVGGVSRRMGGGSLLLGGEAFHDDGPWTHPDNYFKFNGLATYAQGEDARGFSVTARGYHGSWHSSDQIAENAVPLVGVFGTLDPTDGGRSQRYSVQGEWHRRGANSETRVSGYGFEYDLDLFSDFTYFLTDVVRGDQFEQRDRRWVTGVGVRHSVSGRWLGRRVETALGVQVRNDWIHNGLFQAENRVRVEKDDGSSGTVLPATTEADRFTDLQPGGYIESKVQWAERVRSVLALRGDVDAFRVRSLVTAANSGRAMKVLPSPKAGLILGPWASTEFYAQAGFSFHSNDGRGATQTVEPVSADHPYAGTPVARIAALIPTKGGEVGVRTTGVPHLQSTVSVWYLYSASELQQDGDTGGTVASKQPSNRYGLEWANYYTPMRHLAVDFDLASSRALFAGIDAGDAAPGSAGGRRVPEAVGLVVSSGVTVHDWKGLTGSVRLRMFGPRDLTSDGLYRSGTTALVNGEVGYRWSARWRVATELLNVANRRDHDIDYAYTSRVARTAAAAFTKVFHPVEPAQVRFALVRTF